MTNPNSILTNDQMTKMTIVNEELGTVLIFYRNFYR